MFEILSTVVDAKDCDVMELRPIGEVINPDAVEAVLSSDAEVLLRFEYEGEFVRVSSEQIRYEVDN